GDCRPCAFGTPPEQFKFAADIGRAGFASGCKLRGSLFGGPLQRLMNATHSVLACFLSRLSLSQAEIASAASHLRSVQQKIPRSEEHTSELQSRFDLVCRLLLEKKKQNMK